MADLYTDLPEQLATHPTLSLAADGFAERSSVDTGSGQPKPVQLIAHWLPVGRNAGRIVLQFAGVTSIEQAEALAGKEVVIPASERRTLEDGSVYVSDLVGATVFDREQPVGVIAEVLFPATPDGARKIDDAAPLLSVNSPEGDEILIPFASAYLDHIDTTAKVVRMRLPEGLIGINRTGQPDQNGEAPPPKPLG